jgi:lysozyme
VSETIWDRVEQHESFVPHAYQDSLGLWTIGIGRMIDGRKKGGITRPEAELLLENDLDKREAALDMRLSWWRSIDIVRQGVLLEMTFQMGIDGLLKFANTLTQVHRGNYAAAAAGMRRSLWARQTPNRAERLARIMEQGRDVPKWW